MNTSAATVCAKTVPASLKVRTVGMLERRRPALLYSLRLTRAVEDSGSVARGINKALCSRAYSQAELLRRVCK